MMDRSCIFQTTTTQTTSASPFCPLPVFFSNFRPKHLFIFDAQNRPEAASKDLGDRHEDVQNLSPDHALRASVGSPRGIPPTKTREKHWSKKMAPQLKRK